jgi:hypothetical protein
MTGHAIEFWLCILPKKQPIKSLRQIGRNLVHVPAMSSPADKCCKSLECEFWHSQPCHPLWCCTRNQSIESLRQILPKPGTVPSQAQSFLQVPAIFSSAKTSKFPKASRPCHPLWWYTMKQPVESLGQNLVHLPSHAQSCFQLLAIFLSAQTSQFPKAHQPCHPLWWCTRKRPFSYL